jgi:hypothetical protein
MAYDNNDGPIYSDISMLKNRACDDQQGCPYCKVNPEITWLRDYPCPEGYFYLYADYGRPNRDYYGCLNEANYTYILLTEEQYNSYEFCDRYGDNIDAPYGGQNLRLPCCNGVCPPTPCF